VEIGRALAHRLLQEGLIPPKRVPGFLRLQQRRQTDSEFCQVDRFGDKVICARFDRTEPGLFAGQSRHHNDRDLVKIRIIANLFGHFEAVHSGHRRIQKYEVYLQLHLGQRFDSVPSTFRLVP